MFKRFRDQVLVLMRVPRDPAPPYGAPGSVRVFRAGKNYFNLRLTGWSIAQLIALAAIVFWAVILIDVEVEVRRQKTLRSPLPAFSAETFAASVSGAFNENPPPAGQPAAISPAQLNTTSTPAEISIPTTPTATAKPAATPKKKQHRSHLPIDGFDGFKRLLVEFALRLPDWAFPLIWVLKIAGFVIYLAQIPFTYALRRLDYELRWYIVTDRSLRIRTGLVKLQESTMSFANLQQVEVKQDPIQRLLGLADVVVQSAGGGSGNHEGGKGEMHDSLHTGIFHSVENATEIRDLILERLRKFRQAGLGDPDDHHDHLVGGAPSLSPIASATPEPRMGSAASTAALDAAREILAEARALRAMIS